MNVSRRIVLSLFSGTLLIFCFPWFDLSFVVWVALVPLFFALQDQTPSRAFGFSFLTGLTFIIGVFYWVMLPDSVLLVDFILMVSYLALYVALFGGAFTVLSRRAPPFPLFLAVPALWVSLEYLRSHFFFLEFPWALLGHSQQANLALIQIAGFTGVYGISFLIVMANVALFELIRNSSRAVIPLVSTLTLIGLSAVYGMSVLSTDIPERRSLPVTVVQGNVPQGIRWDRTFYDSTLALHARLSQRAVQNFPSSLVVWPETSVPGGLQRDAKAWSTLIPLAKDIETYLLIGTAEQAKFKPKDRDLTIINRSNNASLISPEGRIIQNYRKIKLLPFGEYLPDYQIIPWPSRFVSQAGHLIPGDEYTVFRLPSHNGPALFSAMICWETIFPNLVREFVKGGAMFLVAMSNEAWFSDSAAPYLFVSMNVFRAVENRRAVVRSINGGVSCVIDPFGRISKMMDQDENGHFLPGSFTAQVSLRQDLTFYTRYGDLFAQVVSIAAGLALILCTLRRPRHTLVATEA